MSRTPRDRDPALFRLVTIRTEEARLWMLPSRNMEKLLGGIVARYQELCEIEIYAYKFLSNHPHMVIRAPKSNTDEFMEGINREIAKRVNWKHRRQGNFWGRPYDDKPILSEEDLLEAFLYVNTQATRHGLLEDASEWKSLHSYHHVLSERDRRFTFYLYSEPNPEQRAQTHFLKLTPLPQFESLSKAERRAKIEGLLKERVARLVQERREQGLGFLGHAGIAAQVPGSIPKSVARSPRPPCYTKNAELRRKFRESLRIRKAEYAEASMRFRLGDLAAVFPRHCYKPPLHRKPRLRPFSPLPDDHFQKAA